MFLLYIEMNNKRSRKFDPLHKEKREGYYNNNNNKSSDGK